MAQANISSSLLGKVATNQSCPLFDLIAISQSQVVFSTVLILKSNASAGRSDDHIKLFSSLGVPLLQLTSSEHFQLRGVYRNDLLSIVYLELDSFMDVLSSLARTLNRLAQTRILFVCYGMGDIIGALFKQCWARKMVNAIAFIAETGTYMSYSPFPEIHTSHHSAYDAREVFPNRMRNVFGHPLRGTTDGVEPRDFFYTNRRGENCMGGYAMALVKEFAAKINATLTMPMGFATNLSYHTDHDTLIATDVLDIFIGLAIYNSAVKGESYVVEITNWCSMLPVESFLPVYLYFPKIFGSPSFILMFSMVIVFSVTVNCFLWMENVVKLSLRSLFLKENCLRALFGQSSEKMGSFSMKVRTIYFLSYVMGLFFNTWYLATLDMLYTSPPTEPPIRNIDDLYNSPLKVLVYRPEYLEVSKLNGGMGKYVDTIQFTDDHEYYHAKRNELNRSFVFNVPSIKWKVFKEQQSLYKEPIFRRSDICFVHFAMMVYLLHENSVFTEELNTVIHQSSQGGLFEFWVKRSVLELIEAGRIQLKPESDERRRHEMTVYDLQGVFAMFGILALVSCAVFVAENVWRWFVLKRSGNVLNVLN